MPTPIEVYNKRIKKKEKEKRKKARLEVKTSKKLLEDPEKLKKELDELTHKAIIGRIDAESLERKEKIEKLWDQYNKTKQVKDKEEQETESDESEEKSSSDESDYSTDSEDKPRCVIEIEGELKNKPVEKEPKKNKKGFHDPEPPDEFELELRSHMPKLHKKEEKKTAQPMNNSSYTPRPPPNVIQAPGPYTPMQMPVAPMPPVPPMAPFLQIPMMPNIMNFRPQPPPIMMNIHPSVMQQTHEQKQVQEEKKEPEQAKVPLSKYFVPSQVR
ncbi:conserved hypothetical protein [Theileria orientalis strain Shintoku]|uniref:Wbp11/ELF5/Saf1 N-terminal domain-containing protein n=1 Tax=Theileria orientalis strain Shintoku TaxID=869250 RepID=J4C7E4_THEOR|nr:conserved hypothetical protein [Theileria orientalis strain Shintoku]BAM38893.1 conserved hypothetical protein [Theileria orientalis strain Shintoku]|eukprot:XP_009689194.1 conserved hypothetical protein [Theileria orientalis strain Shintoku]